MSTAMTLGQMISLVQTEVQKSLEYANAINTERPCQGVQMSVTDCEIELPIAFDVVDEGVDIDILNEVVNDMSFAELAEARLALPSFDRGIERELEMRFDQGETVNLRDVILSQATLEKAFLTKAEPEAVKREASRTRRAPPRRTAARPAKKASIVKAKSLKVRAAESQPAGEVVKALVQSRLKLSFKASLR